MLHGWSDGGNSVMVCQPTDVRAGVGLRGLGLTTAGAGVLSVAYLIKLDPQSYRVTGYTAWLATSPEGKPDSATITALTTTADASVCFAGNSTWGLRQTKNRLSESEPEGTYIAILNSDLNKVRYCSVVPGAGVTPLDERRSHWGIASAEVNGKQRILFVGSAAGEREKSRAATPTRNALQEQYGGGGCDGYVVLLDLTRSTEVGANRPTQPGPGPTRASFEIGAAPKSAPPAPPPAGTVFRFSADKPKYVTVDAEIRDRSGKLWPRFYFGKPQDGALKYRAEQPEIKLAVTCPSSCQPKGDQSRRVLGELFNGEFTPPLTFRLDSIGPPKTADLKTQDKGKEIGVTATYYEGKGQLEIGDRKLNVTPKVTLGFVTGKDGAIRAARVTAYLTLKGSELGVRGPGKDDEVDIRIAMRAYLDQP